MTEDKAFPFQDAHDDFKYSPMTFEEGIKDQIYEYDKKTVLAL